MTDHPVKFTKGETMRDNMVLRILFGLILLAGVVALGVYIYNVGVAQGTIASGSLPAPSGESVTVPYYYPHLYRPWGFGFFGCIFPILFFFLLFVAARGLFFHRWHHHGYWNGSRLHDREGQNIPPMVEEWHRKMHSAQGNQESSGE
jgi:hypothetical protein